MPSNDLVYVGFNSRAAALDRETGEIVWQWAAPSGSGYVSLLLDDGALFASVSGYTYRLDPRTGRQTWMNPMKGFGYGVTCIATRRGTTDFSHLAVEDDTRRRSASTGGGGVS